MIHRGAPGLYERVVPYRRTEAVRRPAQRPPERPPERSPDECESDDPAEEIEDLPEFEEIEQDRIVWTAGTQSTVVDGDGSEIGHVVLLDCDEADLLDCYALSERLDGISVVLESSPGSLHIWWLRVGDWEETALDMLELTVEDPDHAASSHRRGYGVLRIAAKVRDDGSRYKTEPELLAVDISESERAQSRPHAEALLSLAEDQGAQREVYRLQSALSEGSSVEWLGDPETLLLDHYGSVDDQTKELLRDQ